MNRIIRIGPAVGILLVAGAACARRRPPAPPPPPAVNEDSLARERARQDSIARAEQARRDSLARLASAGGDRERAIAEARAALTAPVYFDYDSDALSDAARTALDAKVAILNANPALRIRVAGHADDRGSDEYNLALGQRRAAAAKRYLTGHGIGDDRIETISYGEERPAVPGAEESAWSQNRRDEFEIVAGGDQLVPPRPR